MAGCVDHDTNFEGLAIRVRGLVQGVGFRPMVWHLAQECDITGDVLNDGQGVFIRAWGERQNLQVFLGLLKTNAPPLSRIDDIESELLAHSPRVKDFTIKESRSEGMQTSIGADTATCPDCLADILDPDNRRYRYPFTNCTHCGPRLSIIHTVPYDRSNTSMGAFEMCDACSAEYDNPADRRFHAQPNACAVCGPRVWLEDREGKDLAYNGFLDALDQAAHLIQAGHIVAIKGIGGFHLACDASNEKAVAELRRRKRRYDKPFALMVRDVEMVAEYTISGAAEFTALESPQAPIVVMDGRDTSPPIARSVAPAQLSLGFMLPYTPMHHILMRHLRGPIVLTSGNRSNEPQVYDNDTARKSLADIADYWLMHDREIVNRLDDSVLSITAGQTRLLRRARGFAPSPINLPAGFERATPTLAMGGELKNTFCLLRQGQAFLSQHMGDLEEPDTHEDYRNNLDLYRKLFAFTPQTVVIDMHPDYLSSQWGAALAQAENAGLEQVQHHHAHIASCMAEHGMPLDGEKVLGIALDGLGFGSDGSLWGSEFLIADYFEYDRVAHFTPVPLPGGEAAIREPWRNAYAYLSSIFGWDNIAHVFPDLVLVKSLQAKPIAHLDIMIERRLNAPAASSAGRLFDAVAASIGVCFEHVSYEGQAAIEMEALAAKEQHEKKCYGFAFSGDAPIVVNWRKMWSDILDDLSRNTTPSIIAARFHNTIVESIIQMTEQLVQQYGLRTIVLSGGVFQNRLLLDGVRTGLENLGLSVLTHQRVPANDGGLSLGQAVISAARQLHNWDMLPGLERKF